MSDFEEKVLDLLETINGKLDKILSGEMISKSADETSSGEAQAMMKPSEVVEEQKQKELQEDRPSPEGRRVCPNCQGIDFRMEEDKEKVVFQQGGMKMYAKKYVCKNCGYILY